MLKNIKTMLILTLFLCYGCGDTSEDLGDKEYNAGNYVQAYNLYRKAINDSPWDENIYNKYNTVASNLVASALNNHLQGKHQMALDELKPIFDAGHEVADAYILASIALIQLDYLNMNNLNKAIIYLNRTLKIQPKPLIFSSIPEPLSSWFFKNGLDEEILSTKIFNIRDSGNISRAFFYHDIVASLMKKKDATLPTWDNMTPKDKEDIQALSSILDWIIYNIQPLSPRQQEINLIIPHVIHRGASNQLDMVEVFVTLAQQAGISAYPIIPRGKDGKLDNTYTLVTVHIGDKWILLDPFAGIPLLTDGGKEWVCLKKVIENPQLLENLEWKFPFKGEDFTRAVIWITAPFRSSTPRLELIQKLFTGSLYLPNFKIEPKVYFSLPQLFETAVVDFYGKDKIPSDLDPYTVNQEKLSFAYWPYPYQVWNKFSKEKEEQNKLQANLNEALKNYEKAKLAKEDIKTYEETLKNINEKISKWKYLGYIQNARTDHVLGRFDKAIEEYQKLLKSGIGKPEEEIKGFDDKTESNEGIEYYLAIALVSAGNSEEGLKELESYIKKYPEGVWISSVYYHLGMIYESMGNNEEACKAYEKVEGPRKMSASFRIKNLKK